MTVVVLEFVPRGSKQDPGRDRINMTIGITNFSGCLTRTVVRNDPNNNGPDVSAIQGAGNKILTRGRVRRRNKDLRL